MILYQDSHLVVVNKPAGMLVHRSSLSRGDEEYLLQKVRDIVGYHLYPVHRLDRPTSGVVLFALSPSVAAALQQQFANKAVEKIYYAFVRGWMGEPTLHEREVKTEKGKLVEATTHFAPLHHIEYPIATDRYATARYTVVRCEPSTGRWHQIRQHLAQLRHYIINDRVHGDGKQNKLITNYLGVSEMFLHARSLAFTHPESGKRVEVVAPFPEWWRSVCPEKMEIRLEIEK